MNPHVKFEKRRAHRQRIVVDRGPPVVFEIDRLHVQADTGDEGLAHFGDLRLVYREQRVGVRELHFPANRVRIVNITATRSALCSILRASVKTAQI